MEKAFNEVVFLSLSKENQEKVECIYHIALNLHLHKARPITPDEFDALYDKPLPELNLISAYIGSSNRMRNGQ